ncbi:MAG: glutathione S-transferase N-terminal domain-containing protein [Pseudomonadota bacterium]
MTLPVLYSFRRCPYAMRARLALLSSGMGVALREVMLRNKPAEMLEASPKGTVPVLVGDGFVLEESRDIMLWALHQSDPEHLLADLPASEHMIARNDGPFKAALDRYKYPNRFEGADPEAAFQEAIEILADWDGQLAGGWLLGGHAQLAIPICQDFNRFLERSLRVCSLETIGVLVPV